MQLMVKLCQESVEKLEGLALMVGRTKSWKEEEEEFIGLVILTEKVFINNLLPNTSIINFSTFNLRSFTTSINFSA